MEGQTRCFPDKVKLKEFIITKLLLYEMLKGLIKEKDDQNYEQYNDNKLTTINIWSKNKNKNKNKLRKQLEQEQNHRNGDHKEGYQWGEGVGRVDEKVQGIRSINGRYKMDRGRVGIV